MPAVIADFDAIADTIADEPRPRTLTPAERWLLRRVPAQARHALDVGCGDGALARALAERGVATLGLDASPRMVALATHRAAGSPLQQFRIADVTAEAPPEAVFDVVVSEAMVHHLPMQRVVPWLRAAVAPGGVLLVQDVVSREGLRHLPANALAWLARGLRVATGRDARHAAVDACYAAHGAGETYLRPSEVEPAYRELLPGARVRHHLEWRYTVEWRRDA